MLTREQMERVLAEGGSVLHNGQVITHVDSLPSAADLAQGDSAKLRDELRRVDAQIADLQDQKSEIQKALKAASKAKAVPAADPAPADPAPTAPPA